MEHLESGCIALLAGVLQGQVRRRYRMENELLELWQHARREWMLKPNPPMMHSTQEWTGQVVTLWDGKKEVGEQTLLTRVITHAAQGWVIIADIQFSDLVSVMDILNIPRDRLLDIYQINIEDRKVWLYDPLDHFWSDPCDS
jgi:hypothetical protein